MRVDIDNLLDAFMGNYKTPWKKSRTYGDIYGGRERHRFSDDIVMRAHSLQKPGLNDQLPLLIEDNPSKNFYFPLSIDETIAALKSLPNEDFEGITHVWLRRVPVEEQKRDGKLFGQFISGSGVRLIIMYAWPKSGKINYGTKRPNNPHVNEVTRFGGVMKKEGMNWISSWSENAAQKFFSHILFHEVGHHVDQCFRSIANYKEAEEFAEQYAMEKTSAETYAINHLEMTGD